MGASRFGRLLLISLVVLALRASAAQATSVQDLVRMKGHERAVLTGMGIVVGLNGTGDESNDSLLAARPYAELLRNLGYPIEDISELADADSYALVNITMEIPPMGARDGDRRTVRVQSLFNATSLEGGQLIVSPLRLPRRDSPDLMPLAFAEGPILIEGDNPRHAIVRDGGQMIADVRNEVVQPDGTLTLVLEEPYAIYPVATTIAQSINRRFNLSGMADIAAVEDARNIRVRVPEADRAHPAPFIAAMLTINIHPSRLQTAARIVINETRGIILVTGDVFVGPVGVRANGLSITNIVPEPEPSPENPIAVTTDWANVDTTDRTSRASTRLVDLLRAFDQLKVPVGDQIAIIHEMHKTGALHAEIVIE